MGRIISTSSTNTPDTNTSRKEVKITHTHTHTHKTQTYKYTMKITGLIASTMLLLMASAPSGLLASPDNGEFASDLDYKEQVEQEILRYLVEGPFLRQDVPAPR